MKLVIYGLIFLLYVINLYLLFNFRREGLAYNNAYILRNDKSNMQKQRELSILNNSLMNNVKNAYSKVTNFLSFEQDIKTKEQQKRDEVLSSYLKIKPGTQISFSPVREKKPSYLPVSWLKDLKIIDESAGQAGTGGSSAEESSKTEAQLATEERARLLAMGDIVEVDENGPIYDVVSYTSHPDNNLEDVIHACVNNNWFTEKLTKKQMKDTSNAMSKKGLYGWSKKPLEDKPCVGFYSELDNDRKFHILVPCDNDCDQMDVKPISKEYIQEMIDDGIKEKDIRPPKDGEIFYPGNPDEQVGKVWRIKAGQGAKASMARVNLAGNFKELKLNDEINYVEVAKESTSGLTRLQALNECAQKKSNIGNNPCVGVVKNKGEKIYKFLYKAIGQYEPDDKIEEVYRKVGNKYVKVFKGNPLRNVSAILGDSPSKPTAPASTPTEATAPEATAPEATAPEATAVETTAVETTAVETTAPEATAPEATAAEATPTVGAPKAVAATEKTPEEKEKERKEMAEAKKSSVSLMLTLGDTKKDRPYSANYETKGAFAYWTGPYKGKSFFGTGGLESEKILPTKEWSAYRLDGPNCTTLECCKEKLKCSYRGGALRVDPNDPWAGWSEGDKCVAQHKIKKYKWSDYKKCM